MARFDYKCLSCNGLTIIEGHSPFKNMVCDWCRSRRIILVAYCGPGADAISSLIEQIGDLARRIEYLQEEAGEEPEIIMLH